ncbi:hypothetical protein EDB89DRAFT_449566 [Lactarius sanguifluus]|nr:hypothetical protein EDB89DRAFT_449566 [Lactarius sanguifluus]
MCRCARFTRHTQPRLAPLIHSLTFISLIRTMPPSLAPASTAYPPIVHACHDEPSQTPAITDVQPSTGAEMVVGSNDNTAQSGNAERLRGGLGSCKDELVCAIPHFVVSV